MEADAVTRRWTMGGAVVLLSLSLLASLILMSAAIQNSERFGTLFSMLLITNFLGLVGFAVLLVINLKQLAAQLRSRQAGARLTLRMLGIFLALSLLPLLVLYGFSLDFLRRGVDSWFDVRIDRALDDALDLSKNALDLRMRELLAKTVDLAEELGKGSAPMAVLDLDALRAPGSTIVANTWDASPTDLDLLRQRAGADELTLVTPQGHVLESSGVGTELVPVELPPAALLQLRQGSSYIGLEPLGSGGMLVRIAVTVPSDSVGNEQRILHALYPLSARMNSLAESVQRAYAKYNELDYLRDKLTLSFAMTLTLVLLSSMAVAAWAAFVSARRLAAPISALAAGTQAVAEGNYTTTLPVTSSDEIGLLVSSFNAMTSRIANTRAELESQHRYVNTLLSELSSGVLALDGARVITTLNDRGTQILNLHDGSLIGAPLHDLALRREHLRPLTEGLAQLLDEGAPRWQREFQIFTREGRRILMCRGSVLTTDDSAHPGHVVVFDDITALAKGQRDAAWSEVARRLAHEIKNPLTPIQLSAERLRQKYLSKLPPADAETLDRLTSTIVQQVDTMKSMVNTFSDYARPPTINQEQVDVNRLLQGVVDLYRSANPDAAFECMLSDTLPPASLDASRFRQVFNNLIKNALEAHVGGVVPRIQVSTRELATDSGQLLEIRISDAGEGMREDIVGTAFEPYVTNKTRGTGLGLAIVKKIVEEHGGVVTLENNLGSPGASAIIRLPLQTPALGSTLETNRKAS